MVASYFMGSVTKGIRLIGVNEIDALVASMSRGGSPTAYMFCCQICRCLSGDGDCD